MQSNIFTNNIFKDKTVDIYNEYYKTRESDIEKYQYAPEKTAYSSWGEDILLNFIFLNKNDGFYVDIGCYHPEYESNTKILYDRGWNGINIDANKSMIERFKIYRPQNINLNLAVSSENKKFINYFIFDEWATSNTISESFKDTRGIDIQNTEQVKCSRLDEILDKYVGNNKEIDFLNVDVETLDFDVLNSNNWSKYKPTIIAVEDFDLKLYDISLSKIFQLLSSNGYELFSLTLYTSFYVLKDKKHTLNI